jgi:hypothetical protein
MLGFLISAVFGLACLFGGAGLLKRLAPDLDPAEHAGVGGIIALGLVGTLTLFIGLIPGGLAWGIYLVGAVVIAAAAVGFKSAGNPLTISKPEKWPFMVIAAAFGITMLVALLGVIMPSTQMDWDSLAYHIAVPKMWLAAGQIHEIAWIHHSNFPFAVDNLSEKQAPRPSPG